jgi:hypothetical protein
MSAYLDRYLILSERGFKALKSQAHPSKEKAINDAIKRHEMDGSKIVIFEKVLIVEAPNVRVKTGD